MKRKLKVYLPFSVNVFKTQLSYPAAFYVFILISLFAVFVSYALWRAIYAGSGRGVLGGFTETEMIRYIFMSYVTNSIVAVSIMEDVGRDVVRGEVAIYLIKPLDYRLSLIAKAFGMMVYRFLLPGIWIWIGIEVYLMNVKAAAVITPSAIILFPVSCLLSFLIYVLFDFCFGMIAFYTTHIFGMYMVKNAVVGLLSGSLLPLTFFPPVLQQILGLLPFSSMVYTPLMLYLGKLSGAELQSALLRQVIWLVVLYGLGSLIWRRVTGRLVILGG
ncbi:MAG: ABC-2 family transporter protein [Lachnospiraceae bacterium]|nr:ABC-2 family transporter protein [Lachnospiraceae bacterium]MDY5741710.1 ABC-2 family transporter protein [Lachnospiraceae bacterium]